MLTNAQRNTLLAAVKADATAGPIRTIGDVTGLVSYLNGAATPTALAWLPAAPVMAVEEAPNYTTYDSLAQGKRDSWMVFLRSARDFGKAKVRNWVVDIWGAATASSNAESVLKAATESATVAQVAIGGASKTTGTVTAMDRAFDEQVSTADGEWLCQQA